MYPDRQTDLILQGRAEAVVIPEVIHQAILPEVHRVTLRVVIALHAVPLRREATLRPVVPHHPGRHQVVVLHLGDLRVRGAVVPLPDQVEEVSWNSTGYCKELLID